MTDKEKIRAEVERRYNEKDRLGDDIRANVYKSILRFIDSMQEEPVSEEQVKKSLISKHEEKTCKENGNSLTQESVSEDLNTVAKEYANNITEKIGYRLQLRRAVCFGANWQRQQDNNDANHALVEQIKTQQMWYEKGMADMKQQLMAKAVDGVVHHFEKCGVASVHYTDPTLVPMAYFTSPEGLSVGDKIKIIVIKED